MIIPLKMIIPLDIIREISLYLPYNYLAISKELSDIYNDSWFRDKLLGEHPNCVKNNNSWSDLYKRSLKSGQVIKFTSKSHYGESSCITIPIECIKISNITRNLYIFLTFDNNLYSCYHSSIDEWVTELIDSNVKDIDNNSYIKDKELYLVTDKGGLHDNNSFIIEKSLIIKTDEKFIDVSYNGDYIFAITKNALYCYFWYDPNERELITIYCQNNFRMVDCGGLMIQHENLSISTYNPYDNILSEFEMSNIKEIYPGVVKLIDDTLINIDYDDEDDDKDNYEGPRLITTIIPSTNNKFQASIEHYGENILLIDGNVFKFNTTSSGINPDYGLSETITSTLTLIHENVKNISGYCGTHYYIV